MVVSSIDQFAQALVAQCQTHQKVSRLEGADYFQDNGSFDFKKLFAELLARDRDERILFFFRGDTLSHSEMATFLRSLGVARTRLEQLTAQRGIVFSLILVLSETGLSVYSRYPDMTSVADSVVELTVP